METPVPALPKADFPDWLSPMLVKELRQGVRTRVFVTLFILLQVAMLLTVSLTLLVAANEEDTTTGGVFFWIIVGVPILVVLPLTALGAVGGEIKANTLELIFLTRLTAFRIVAGKWFAVFVQALLFVCAVLPYLVLRYFVGGINLTVELTTLGLMLAASMLCAGIATGLSAYPTRVVRTGVGFLLVSFFGLGADPFLFRGIGRGVAPGLPPGWPEIAGYGLCGIIFLLLMLDVGAAKIAPPAENHSAVLRLLALAGLAVAAAVGWKHGRGEGITILALLIATFVCAIALCEEPRWIPSLFRPFAARGWIGRAAGHLFYPGWYSGVVFTALVFAGFGALLVHQEIIKTDVGLARFVALGGLLLFPVALVRLFLPRTRRALVFFFVVQIVCAIVTVFCLVCDQVLKTSFSKLCSFLPLSTLILSIDDDSTAQRTHLIPVVVTTGASLLVLLAVSLRPWRQARRAETESLRLPLPAAPTPDATLA